MPWTRRQVRYLLSSGSPLSSEQREKMKGELHSDPAMGHARKGSSQLRKSTAKQTKFSGSAASYSHSRPKQKRMKRTY